MSWLADIHPAVFVVAGGVVYLFLAGLTFGMVTFDQSEEKYFGAVFWPVVWVAWVIYRIAIAGPRLLRWLKERKRAKDLPRARMVP